MYATMHVHTSEITLPSILSSFLHRTLDYGHFKILLNFFYKWHFHDYILFHYLTHNLLNPYPQY